MIPNLSPAIKLSVLLLFVSFTLNAQKVDLDKYWYNAESKVLPTKPMPEGKRTYRVTSRGSSIANESVPNSSVIDRVVLHGFKRVSGKAHVNCAIEFGDLVITSSKTETRKEEKKDKNNVVTSTTYYYKKTIVYNMSVSGKVTSETGTLLNTINSNSYEGTWSTREFSSSSDADNYYRNSYNDIRRELATEKINTYISNVNNTLNSNYGYPDVQTRDHIWVQAAKKHPEFAAQQENWEIVKTFIASLKGNESITEAQMDQVKPAIEYYQSIKTKYKTDEKNDKKIRYQAFFALSTIYILMDDLDKAKKEAEGLIANDYDEKDGKRFLEEIEKIKKAFDTNNVKSRHYHIDPELNNAPN